MAEGSKRFGNFMAENVPVKRWKFYRVQFVGLALGWIAIQHIFETNKFRLLTAFAFASAVCAFNAWSEMRRADVTKSTTNIQE